MQGRNYPSTKNQLLGKLRLNLNLQPLTTQNMIFSVRLDLVLILSLLHCLHFLLTWVESESGQKIEYYIAFYMWFENQSVIQVNKISNSKYKMIKVDKIWIFWYIIDIMLFIFPSKKSNFMFHLCSIPFMVFSITYTICEGLKLDT